MERLMKYAPCVGSCGIFSVAESGKGNVAWDTGLAIVRDICLIDYMAAWYIKYRLSIAFTFILPIFMSCVWPLFPTNISINHHHLSCRAEYSRAVAPSRALAKDEVVAIP